MVARTISARRSGATPRLGLMPVLSWLDDQLSLGTATPSSAACRAGAGRVALARGGAAALGRALGFQPLEVDRRVIGEGHRRGDGGMARRDQAVHRLADSTVRGVALRGRP